jgi:hypothetical protein
MLGDLGTGHAGRHQGDDLAPATGQLTEQPVGRHSSTGPGIVQRQEPGNEPTVAGVGQQASPRATVSHEAATCTLRHNRAIGALSGTNE